MNTKQNQTIEIKGKRYELLYVPLSELSHPTYNPRKWTEEATKELTTSVEKFEMLQPLVVNFAKERKGIIIGGNFRYEIMKKLNYKEAPVIAVYISDIKREQELNIRLNKAVGDWSYELLADFDEAFLSDLGFSSEELDKVFDFDIPEEFDLTKELQKLNITKIEVNKGDVYQLGDSRIMCGDSTLESDIVKLMNGEKADLCLTDPPYILDYLHGKKKHNGAVTGFGAKRDRRYLETDVLPPDFTEKWMANIHKIQKEHFSIICYENWKNIRTIWGEMEKYWKVKNMIVWHLPNRHQGFSAKYKFFSKHDIAMVGASPNTDIEFNNDIEKDGLQEEYDTALYAISGKPTWESYEKGKKFQPTDFIEHIASDAKHSGQGIIFGTKPIEILIPYIKVLTKRGDLIIEPFGGAGSTLIAATKMKRRCYLMEKSPVYAEVIKKRWENLTGKKGVRIS